MRPKPNRLGRRFRLAAEALEDRAVPASFGVPWGDPGHLTLSFVPDGTPIASHVSTLSASLNSQMSTTTWESTILRAFQTWAANANINIGLTTDSGAPLGSAGPAQHDPRFGDIRIGAQTMTSESLAVTVPYDFALSGTWSGDVLLNSNGVFDGKTASLLSVALHESGHVLGLDESNDPNSPLFANMNFATAPTSADIKALQALYGTRAPDLYEGSSGNDSISKATTISQPGNYRGATPLVVFGDVTNLSDNDVYAIRSPSGYTGPITIRLQSAGLSLLTTRLEILDSRGKSLGVATASSDFGDIVTLNLPKSDPNQTYFLQVQGATKDVFGIGSYGLAVSYDATSVVSPSVLDHFLRTASGPLNQDQVAASLLSTGNGLTNDDHHSDDSLVEATDLTTTPGFAANSHYEVVGSLSDSSDVDFYRLVAANSSNNAPVVMTVTVRSLSGVAPPAQISIFDRDGAPVAAQILANGNGTFTIQASGLKAGVHYYLKVPGNQTPAVVGNYSLTTTFASSAADLSTFASGTLADSGSQTFNLYVAESQLFQFLLNAWPSGTTVPGSAVHMSVFDANGLEVFRLTAPFGQTVSGPTLFLTPGPYTIRFSTVTAAGDPGPMMNFTLLGESISDPIGPTLSDPTLAPIYKPPGSTTTTQPVYVYPGNISSSKPFLITSV